MEGKTHVLGGALAGIACVAMFSPESSGAMLTIGAGMFGSLLPDLDHPGSILGREVPLISSGITQFLGHRGPMHSILAAIVVWLGAWGLATHYLGPTSLLTSWLVALVLGYLSHLALDALNPSGVPILWPLKKHARIPLVTTGSAIEKLVVFPVLLCLCVAMGVLVLSPMALGFPALGFPDIGEGGAAGIVVTMFKGWMKFMEFLGEVIMNVIFKT